MFLRRFSAAKMHSALHLAALEDVSNLLSEVELLRAQFIRKPKLNVQVAMIYRAQFAGQGAAGELGDLSRKACHTV